MPYCVRPALLYLFLVLINPNSHALPPGITLLSDIPYGKHADQVLDVYAPAEAHDAPVIFMVHGGAWRGGDKARKAEFDKKVAHWGTKGFVFVSTNYRTLPERRPVGQAEDVAAAIRFAQNKAPDWGGSSEKFILMGHSAGAHLISLVSSKFSALTATGMIPWLGTVSLDSGPYDIVKRMTSDMPSDFYRQVFGDSRDEWEAASPFYSLDAKIPPFLAICSTQRDAACDQSTLFLQKAESFGSYGELLPIDLSHNDINSALGAQSCFTGKVDTFLEKLSPSIEALLARDKAEQQTGCAAD